MVFNSLFNLISFLDFAYLSSLSLTSISVSFLLFSVSLAFSLYLLSFIFISYLLFVCVFVFPTCLLMFLLVKEIILFLPIEYGCFLYHTCLHNDFISSSEVRILSFVNLVFNIYFILISPSHPHPRKSDLISCHWNDTQFLSPAIDIFSHSKIQNRF